MITSNDVQLSNLSFTNKDFGTIYPDLLDLAKVLTNRWDPSTSNESDPGVVLLKEGAFIADHNNYNIDKNVLENFLPSATQDSSVRNILDMNGYAPRYYVAATGKVSFSYACGEGETFSPFILPPFSVVVADDQGNYPYTLVSNLSIQKEGVAFSADFIQGTIQQLTVDGSSSVQLDNLDDNNRLYLPITQVAANGIYIKNIGESDYWTRKDYVTTEALKSKVYKIGYDSNKRFPYIEFPSDISTIIGSGLNIWYTTTLGDSGNVGYNTLVQIISSKSVELSSGVTIDMTKFTVSNSGSITNGKDPETIDQMYESFKRVVGTFDTLVTRRDYTNAVNTVTDSDSQKYISNGYATDINNDYNHALNIITYDSNGTYIENASLMDSSIGIVTYRFVTDTSNPQKGDIKFATNHFEVCTGITTEGAVWEIITTLSYDDFTNAAMAMSPYTLYIYALRAFSINEFSIIAPEKALNNSFTPASDSVTKSVISAINDYKCISHTLKVPETGDIYCYKNYVPLNITITPYNKVTLTEKEEIINNMKLAINNEINAGCVSFGEELDYDSVLQILLNSDERIKNIRLEDFEYTPYVLKKTVNGSEEIPLYDYTSATSTNLIIELVSKNVLAGRMCLFDFDNEFEYKYGQTNMLKYEGVSRITSKLSIPVSSVVTSVSQNTNIANYNFSGVAAQGNTIKISLHGSATAGSVTRTIANNSEYQLEDDEHLSVDRYSGTTLILKNPYVNTSATKHVLKNVTGSTITLAYNGETPTTVATPVNSNVQIIVSNYSSATAENTTNVQYVLKKNEYIHVLNENYTSDEIFPAFVNYRFISSQASAKIPKGADYTLKAGESIIFKYTSGGEEKEKQYGQGNVLMANFDVYPTTTTTNQKTYTTEYGAKVTEGFDALGSTEQIEHRKLLETLLTSASTPCYWVTSRVNNTLFGSNEYSTILSSNEYFVVSDSTKTTLHIYGAGTKIIRESLTDTDWSIPEAVSIDKILSDGFNSGMIWRYKDFSGDNNHLHLQEMNILTLGPGDSFTITNWTTPPAAIENLWVNCDGTISYIISEQDPVTLPELLAGYLLRSKLLIALNNSSGQTLLENQSMTIKYGNDQTKVIPTLPGEPTSGTVILSNATLNMDGMTEVDLSIIKNFNIVTYIKVDSTFTPTSGTATTMEESNGKYLLVLDKAGVANLKFTYTPSASNDRKYILPMYLVAANDLTNAITVQVTDSVTPTASTINIREFGLSTSVSSISITKEGLYLIELDIGANLAVTNPLLLKITNSTANESDLVLTLFMPSVNFGLNKNAALPKTGGNITLDDVVTKIKSLIASSTKPHTKPYYINVPEDSMAILDDDISNPNIFWDINNVVNYMSIPQVNLADSNIDIIKSMRNY